ncbi:hypothetical protein [Bacteriophage Titan-X]|uniref:Uncharacterized protein n=1 Tax=Bacteriophage Titan-X TaxID=2662140 RepID=A0A5Q2U8F0_9CAUD|nr:hypothetical protein [Bacteriophage Titan-X]
MSKSKTALLVKSYHNSVAFGGRDHEESLHDAINGAFHDWPEEARAELFTRIAEAWEGFRGKLVSREFWIGEIVRKLNSERTAANVKALREKNNG